VSRATATYVYCLVRSAAPPPLAEAPDGLPGATPPRALALGGDLWLVVADVPLPEYDAAAIEDRLTDLTWVSDRALAHERVVEHVATLGPALPMKLFTLFRTDERAAAQMRPQREEIGKTLDRIAGKAEWGLRILFREDEARRRAAVSSSATGDGKERPVSGTGFLLRKKAEKESTRDLIGNARTAVDQGYAELAARASEARRRQPEPGETGARLLLDAAFLVPSDQGEAFEAEVRRLAERLAVHACDVTLTGPWPPYNFLSGDAG
jgi:Gas vesicle synthesis protein GvpL/GvpF